MLVDIVYHLRENDIVFRTDNSSKNKTNIVRLAIYYRVYHN